MASDPKKPRYLMEKRAKRKIIIHVSGSWTIDKVPPSPEEIIKKLREQATLDQILIDAQKLKRWDSTFVLFLATLKTYAEQHGIAFHMRSVPEGALHLLQLSIKSPSLRPESKDQERPSLLARIGQWSFQVAGAVIGFHSFLGEVVLGFANIIAGKSKLRFGDLLLYLQHAGAMALPIVSLVSFLVGLILAFVATVQLKIFGAQIFVADLVGIAMARDMGAMMVGIIMAGRTGATYAAQLGTMQVNEEIDALRTLGLRPIEFLVIPRIIALSLMMVPLCIYADLLGIAGGAFVGAGFSDVTLLQYISETQKAVPLSHFFIGLGKCFIYGIIVALIGCRKGLSCGRSAAAVGKVTTSAVVTSIVWIIVACAIITIICYVYRI